MILAIWLIAAIFIALWSLAGWGLYAVVSTGTAWAGDLGPLIARIPYSAVVEAWVPGWIDTLKFIAALTQAGLSWLGGAAPVVVGIVWALGLVVLLGAAGLLTMIVALVRKSTPVPASVKT
jgi:hypothetical protein